MKRSSHTYYVLGGCSLLGFDGENEMMSCHSKEGVMLSDTNKESYFSFLFTKNDLKWCIIAKSAKNFSKRPERKRNMFKILIAEDDLELRQLFQHVLTKNGYTVKGVSNGQEALDSLGQDYCDLVISDIMMPVMDGYELVRSLRDSGSHIPVLMITAKDAFDDMRLGFLSGTDDYMVKPVNVNEMVLRVGALLRRAQMINDRRQVLGNTTMACDSLTVTTEGMSMVLPQKEFMLLYKMASFPGKIFTRQQLMDDIWGYDSETETHTVDVHIGRLRERFRDNPDFKIVTIRGVGYKVVRL